MAGGCAEVGACLAGAVEAERDGAGRGAAARDGAAAGDGRRAYVEADLADGRGEAARRPPLGREDLLPIFCAEG